MTRSYRLGCAAFGWMALILQLWLMLASRPADQAPTLLVNYFSYFTILANILVATCQTASAAAPASRIGRFFLKAEVRGATALYIAVVMATYITLLNGLIPLSGVGWVVDRMLHYIAPPLFLLDWLVLTPHGRLRWSVPVRWLAVPLIYGIWTFVHGAFSGFYPYPFLNVTKLGAPHVALTSVAMALFFLALGFLFVGIDQILARRGPRPASPQTP